MTTEEAILVSSGLSPLDKLSFYMAYFCEHLYLEAIYNERWEPTSFDTYCRGSNIIKNDTGVDDWKERGFASKSWTNLNAPSIYHSVYHNLK